MKRIYDARVSQIFADALPAKLHLRSDLHLARKAWHMLMGLVIALIYMSGMSRTHGVLTLGFFLGLDLMVEALRLRVPSVNEKVLRYWGPIMRSCEVDRLSGTPYYLSAAILAIGIFPKPIAILSIVYLACGDPIASLFGILYGNRGPRLMQGKSLIGTLAGVLACMLATLVFLKSMAFTSDLVLPLALIGGIAGGAAELLPLEVDDNFSIPIVSGFVLWLAFILLGV